jgi:hypothetical protein
MLLAVEDLMKDLGFKLKSHFLRWNVDFFAN